MLFRSTPLDVDERVDLQFSHPKAAAMDANSLASMAPPPRGQNRYATASSVEIQVEKCHYKRPISINKHSKNLMAKLQMKFEPWCCQSFASTDESKRADGEIDRPTALLGPMVKNKQILADYMIQEETKNQEKFMLDSNLQPLACKSKRSDHSAICPIDEKRGKEENVILTPRADDAGFEPKPLAERPMAQMNLDCAWNLYAKGAGLQERVKRTLFEENIKPNMEKNTYQVDQDIINGKFLPPINEKTVEVDRFKKEKICIYRSDSNPQPLGQQSHSLNKLANSPIEEKKRTYAEVVKARPVAKMLMRPGLPPRYAQVDQISYSHPEACLAGKQDRQLNRIDQKSNYKKNIADRDERLK